MKNKPLLVLITLLVILSIVTACNKKTTPTPVKEVTEEPAAPVQTEEPAAVTEAPRQPSNEDANALPPEPQPVSIPSTDGVMLDGFYYPAAVENAPLVVFMHWVGGDKADWYELAVWLQNRGQANPFTNPADMPWWDPSWFPSVPADRSYAVLIFSFRDCQPYTEGCQTMDQAGWLEDAVAAMRFAREIEGIDPERIAAIGSSIGADGAADACERINEEFPGTCQGSLSLSPGDFLEVSYSDVVSKMGNSNPPVAAWCLADESEYGVCKAAEGASNPAVYKAFLIPDGSHGNMLLRPDLDPLPMRLILDFLEETLR